MRSKVREALATALLCIGGVAVAGCPLEPLELPPACSLGGCDDGNPCTADICDPDTGACRFVARAVGTACGDDDACNGVEQCSADGRCESGDAPELDDGDPCTADSCDSVSGVVAHALISGCFPVGWRALSTTDAPSARTLHTAVWTGSKLIVWGGKLEGVGNVSDTGALYDPATDSWSPVSSVDAPSPRHSHSSVWTGSHMLVWGGFGASDYETTGARYDPDSDSWSAMTATNAPSGRTLHRTVWTGSEMVIWGGLNGVTALASGARYDPSANQWQPISSVGATSARLLHQMVWSDSQVIVWGGTNTFDWLSTGGYYDPSNDSWTGATSGSGLQIRQSATNVWTGEEMVIWGGWDGGNYLSDGAALDPDAAAGGSWTPLSTSGAPSERARQFSLWTGELVVIWGGCAGQVCDVLRDDGATWDPSAGDGGLWQHIPSSANLSERIEHQGAWTGEELIIWGGRDNDGPLGDGARLRL
jgi:N-acetylneuraminic acid mutarotase